MRLVQMDEKTAQTRRESLPPEEREKAKPAADLIQQLGQTIATRGAIAVRSVASQPRPREEFGLADW